jgi:hypothetical protein
MDIQDNVYPGVASHYERLSTARRAYSRFQLFKTIEAFGAID